MPHSSVTSSPLCRYYDQCGGCSLQHLDAESYHALKRDILVRTITRLGCDASIVQPLVFIGAHQRRRIEFKVRTHKGAVELGFHAAQSHAFVAVKECPMALPSISHLVAPLGHAIAMLKKPSVVTAVHLTATDQGIDMQIRSRNALASQDRDTLIAAIRTLAIIRLSEHPQNGIMRILYADAPVCIRLEGLSVELPPHAFLQATHAGQDAICQAVFRHMHTRARLVDLYCGCGTYSLPLAMRGHVIDAYEGDAEMVAALYNATLRHDMLAALHVQTRDLVKQPVSAAELSGFDGAIINPPRNGATPQVRELAASTIAGISMVSCNPATFERDARILLQAGFVLKEAVPIDQFYQTRHLELVAWFERT